MLDLPQFRLASLALLPQRVATPSHRIPQLIDFPRFKLEVYLGTPRNNQTNSCWTRPTKSSPLSPRRNCVSNSPRWASATSSGNCSTTSPAPL